jgi:tagatose 6-phosphate kinase
MVVVGGHSGAHVVDMIEQQDGVECVPAWVASPTRTITTVLEESVHRQTAFFEPGSRVTDEEAGEAVDLFAQSLTGVEVVAFSGTVSDPNIKTLYRSLIPIAKEHGAVTILDSHGPEFALGLEAVPHMVKPNVAETEELVGYRLDTAESKWRAIGSLHDRGVTLVALSLGKDGALVSQRGDSEDQRRFCVVPPSIREVNPVGSGDAFVAGFAIGLMEGMDLEQMAILACAAGTANAMSWDIGHFTRAEVREVAGRVRILPAE